MSASDHVSMQFKITQAQRNALENYLINEDPDELGFTHNYETKSPSISVTHLGKAALNVGHAAGNLEFSNEENKQRGASTVAKGLWNLSDKLREQHTIAQAAGVMVGGKKKEMYE